MARQRCWRRKHWRNNCCIAPYGSTYMYHATLRQHIGWVCSALCLLLYVAASFNASLRAAAFNALLLSAATEELWHCCGIPTVITTLLCCYAPPLFCRCVEYWKAKIIRGGAALAVISLLYHQLIIIIGCAYRRARQTGIAPFGVFSRRFPL